MKKRNKIKAKQQRVFLHQAQGRLLRKTQDRPFEMLRTGPSSRLGGIRTGPSKYSGQAHCPAMARGGYFHQLKSKTVPFRT